MYLTDSIRSTSELSSTFKLFLHTLASYSNTDGTCWPGQRAIAQAMSMSIPTVQRCLKLAIELQLVEVRRRWRKSNVYKLLCCKPVKLSPMTSLDDVREQPDSKKNQRLNGSVDRLPLKPKSPHDIRYLLEEIADSKLFGRKTLARNRGWFIRIAKYVEESTIYESMSWLKQAVHEAQCSGSEIKSRSALFTWYLRQRGAPI